MIIKVGCLSFELLLARCLLACLLWEFREVDQQPQRLDVQRGSSAELPISGGVEGILSPLDLKARVAARPPGDDPPLFRSGALFYLRF